MTTVIDNVNNKNQLNFYSSGSETLSYTLVSKNNENLLVLHDVKFVFSSHSLERLVKDVGSCDIKGVVALTNGQGIDLQVLLTKLFYVVNRIDYLYYYGQEDLQMERIVEVSFPNTKAVKLDSEIISFNEYSFGYYGSGNLLRIQDENRTALLFGKYGEKTPPDLIENSVDLIIAYDYLDVIHDFYGVDNIISLRRSYGFKDAESGGYVNVYFK
jgi:hypothetical protein